MDNQNDNQKMSPVIMAFIGFMAIMGILWAINDMWLSAH